MTVGVGPSGNELGVVPSRAVLSQVGQPLRASCVWTLRPLSHALAVERLLFIVL